ncbi:MAG: prolyl oligopeptidase family serine peptidase [Gemmatimonadota bacterium]
MAGLPLIRKVLIMLELQTLRRIGIAALSVATFSLAATAQSPAKYPITRKDATTDNYFGTVVADPYRWLEDQNSKEVERWVDAENKATFSYLEKIPFRSMFRAELTKLYNVPRVSVPFRVAGKLYYSKNTGLQNQSVVFEQASLNGTPRKLIDPNTLFADGSTQLAGYVPSPDGKYFAYSLSVGGSDWSEVHIKRLSDIRELADTVHWVKYSGTAWTEDGKGFFYTRYPTPNKDSVLTAKAINGKIYYHTVGTPDSKDRMIYERPDRPDWYLGASLSEDGRFLSITMNHGTEPNNLLYVADLKEGKHPDLRAPIVPVYTGNDAEYYPLGSVGDTIIMQTTANAPKRKVVSFVLSDTSRAHWRTVVPEGKDVLETSTLAGRRVITQTLEDVKSRLRMFEIDGRSAGDIELPGIGTVGALSSRNDTPELFYAYTSFLTPSTVYRFDFKTGASTAFQRPRVPFDAAPFETMQVFYTSKDGTRVPMFITAKKGLTLDGSHPTVLYAYGGFNISNTPGFSSNIAVWLQHGGVYALANLRGGGEYGDAWHRAGMLEKKQNVFDDFIAAAEYLVKEKYTSPSHLAIHGYSNGGLLVGAVQEQRPDLFAVAYPGAGVMDMLRYDKFSAGIGWVAEYGSSSDSSQFKTIYKYSPVHNVKPGVCYPATIVTTADHDDRVVPGHSYKFAAAIQAAQACDRPTLLRVETKTSHGYMPTDKRIAQAADIWSFTAWNTGMRPPALVP